MFKNGFYVDMNGELILFNREERMVYFQGTGSEGEGMPIDSIPEHLFSRFLMTMFMSEYLGEA